MELRHVMCDVLDSCANGHKVGIFDRTKVELRHFRDELGLGKDHNPFVRIFNRTKVELRQVIDVTRGVVRYALVGIFTRTNVELRQLPNDVMCDVMNRYQNL